MNRRGAETQRKTTERGCVRSTSRSMRARNCDWVCDHSRAPVTICLRVSVVKQTLWLKNNNNLLNAKLSMIARR